MDTAREKEIKEFIIEALNIEDVTPADIQTEAPLFVEGLGLDSIDALELGMAVRKKYGVKFSNAAEDNKRHFASVKALAAFVDGELG